MPRFKMEVYTQEAGVELTLVWHNEEEFNQAIRFLNETLAGHGGLTSPEPGKPRFCYLETQEQLNALHDFRVRQRQNRRRL